MQSISEVDLGTPARSCSEQIDLTVDGRTVRVPGGTSVLRAAALAGLSIPKLCATDQLEAFGSCRLCLVQIDGMKGYPAACTTTVTAGMSVTTQNSRLAQLRRGVMELYISDHPLDCLTCPANGHCELQDMAGAVGLRSVRYGYAGANHLQAEKDESNPYFTFDPSKCIVCSRCVRACDEQQGTLALTIDGRGFASKVVASQDDSFLASECVSCGACVQACPTATLSEKSLIASGQPQHSIVTTCGYCGVGCSFRAEMPRRGAWCTHGAEQGRPRQSWPFSCVKGRFAIGYSGCHPDRITRLAADPAPPSTRPWRGVSWQEAIAHAASELRRIQALATAATASAPSPQSLHQRGNLPHAETGTCQASATTTSTPARGCVAFADGVWTQEHSPGESAGTQRFRLGDVERRRDGHRRHTPPTATRCLHRN